MKVGLISDTHNKLPDSVSSVFRQVDIILHAGDIGNREILDRLKTIAPVHAVYGNTDIYSLASTLPSRLELRLGMLQTVLIHSIGNVRDYAWKIKKGIFHSSPELVVYGHTHHPNFQKYMGYYFANPGSAGMPSGKTPLSVMILHIKEKVIDDHQIIELK